MRELSGQAALVTGASRGIGRAVALELAAAGAAVVVGYHRQREQAEAVAAAIRAAGGAAEPLQVDVRDPAACEAAVSGTVDRFGRIDILVNNAGLGRFGKVHELSEEDWDQMMAVNLKGAFLACKYAIPHLIRQKGHIVNISSVAGTVTFPGGGGYCASKFGLMALSEVLTQELKPHEVRVSTLCPGSILTEFGDPKPYALKPEQVAETVWQMISAPRGVIYNQIIMRPQVPPEMQK